MSVNFHSSLNSNVQKHLVVEKAREFEQYKHLPKYNHVPYAVIHPSPRKKKELSPQKDLTFTMSGSSSKLIQKKYEPKVFPDHLMRAPLESTATPSYATKKSPSRSKSMKKGKSLREQKKQKENAKKFESEKKRIVRADKNLKDWFGELKKLSERSDEEPICQGSSGTVAQGKLQLRERKFIRFLYQQISGAS